MEYGQFCPIAKATEIIGEKWTVLIIREALMGSTRYSEFQRGLSLISPTLLAKRLDSLEKRAIKEALEATGWHQGQAAELLGISDRTLYRKIRSLGLRRPG